MLKKAPYRLWLTTLALGWLFDALFWRHEPGISFAVFTLAVLIVGIGILTWEGVKPARNSLFILGLVLFFAVFTFVRAEPLSTFLAHVFTLLALILLAVTWQGGRWLEYGLADYFARLLDLLASTIARPLIFQAEVNKAGQESDQTGQKPSQFWPVIRGLLLAIPLLAFFASLLSSADMVFAARLDELVKLLSLENLPEYIFRAIYIAMIGYALAGVYLHAASRSTDEKLIGLDKPLVPRFFGFTEASMMLGGVVLLFGVFVAIQFQYFFGGRANIAFEGFTYADYARRGFGELVMVAFFSLLLFLGLSVLVKRETERQAKIFSGLGLLLFLLVGVMLVSAFQRLLLYEAAYGFTRLRTYTHVFIIWLAVLLAATVVLDVLGRQRLFALMGTLAAIGFAATLLLLNVDGFIVRQNVQRAITGEELDAGYLASLSPDATPVMAGLYQTPGLDQPVREKLGAALACQKAWQGNPDEAWQSFHLSRSQARVWLEQVDLSGFDTGDDNYTYEVSTPSGQVVSCYSATFD